MSEVGTLKKGIDILWLIIKKGEITVHEIMKLLSYNRSTTYRLVNTLEQNGLIQKTKESTYKVSSDLIEELLNYDNTINFDLGSGIILASDELKEMTGETLFVGISNGTHVLATHIIPGSFPTRTHYEKGDKLPLYYSAVGKCILAFQPNHIKEVYIKNFITDEQDYPESLLKELEQIKKVGYAIDNEEAEAGVRCIAAPIWREGRVIAGVAISGPSLRVSPKMDEENSKVVKLFAQKISDSLTQY